MTRRSVLVHTGLALIAVVLLWILPVVGLPLAMVALAVIPPWGRSLIERGLVSGLIIAGLVALAFPRAGSTPVTWTTAKLVVTLLVVGALALRLVPRWRAVGTPRPTLSDVLVLVLGASSAWWLMAAYVGRTTTEIVSGLFFSGWDNQAHYTTFANTYKVGSTTWPTGDGSIAWNQWYPSLHSTLWALAQLASQQTSNLLSRPDLLWPYVLWSSVSFALCLAALGWVAGDVAARLAGPARRWARPLAIAGFAVFALLGSPAFMFNAGFTNFMMGVTVLVVSSYLSARSWRSARSLGWFLVPLAALSIIGLWTPLALGLVPAGVVVAIALLRRNRWLGVAWLVGSAVLGVVMAVTQSQAILAVEPGTSAGDLTSDLGSVGAGMSEFNVGAALLAPFIVAAFAVILVRSGLRPMAVAVAGPVAGAAVIALVFAFGADDSGVSRLQSYYVLKPLNAMLIAMAPLIAAGLAVLLVRVLAAARPVTAIAAAAMAGLVAVGFFGYVGVLPALTQGTIDAAPGVQAGADRTQGINDPLVGEAIIRGRDASVPYPEYTSLLWDGAGTLPNLWVSSLREVMSKKQNEFYKNLPSFPYDEKTTGYVTLALNLDPDLRVAVLWFRPPSGELLELYVKDRGDDRVKLVHVPMPSSPLCPECSL